MDRRLALIALVAVGCRSAEPARTIDPLEELGSAFPVEPSPNGTVRTFDIVAAEAVLAVAGGEQLRVWAYNGQVPGPALRLRLGETLRVRFTNRLPQETTIHWHGVRVPNHMDGVPHATQPPVAPGASFTYEFTPKDAGTYWFHPHVRSSEQVERGLYGLLIVEDTQPPPYSRDIAWIVDDWLLDETGQVMPRFNTPHDLSHDGRWGNVITVDGRTDTKLQLAVGERVRLRLLNASNGRVYAPELRGLAAHVIAVDGTYTRQPFPLERFELAPGNRLDLDIVVTGEPREVAVVDRFYDRQPNRLATIEVVPGSGAPPSFAAPTGRVPSWSKGLYQPIDHTFTLDVRRGGPLGLEWTINDVAFAGHHASHHHPSLALARGKWTRMRFVNASPRLHPIHLHGMFFKVLARDSIPVDEPFFRDTVLIRGRESIDIGLVPLDAGDWMMHCHILEHAEAGMMTMLAVR